MKRVRDGLKVDVSFGRIRILVMVIDLCRAGPGFCWEGDLEYIY